MGVPFLAKVCVASYVIPAAIGVRRFHILRRDGRLLAVLCVVACFQLIGEYVSAWMIHSNYFLSDTYKVIETSLLCGVFYYSLESRTSRVFLLSLGLAFGLVWVVDMVYFRDPDRMNSGLEAISRLFLITMSSIALYSGTDDGVPGHFEKPVFWVSLGVILYSAGTLFLYGLSNQLLKLGLPYFAAGWTLNWLLIITANLLYTKAMLCKPQA